MGDDNEVKFDYAKLNEVVQSVTINMNKVTDNHLYILEQARASDMKNRPIGIGVQGLSEVFAMMKVSFDSPLTIETNKKIFETIYYGVTGLNYERPTSSRK
ncbi:hypothetical protein F441_14639 [Phytophthora nicotianae CJ01A1]|uniref:Ribonucleotide reductase large subunit C-terminal domain-containing protein n=2 Tax=Phytophthora nicotianae TaxID=4792 RepID=W2WIR3_PHYNI|nr:hypothetical protein L915_14373 [Phytophthora nicotianae]ETP09494.1 hypothetical protein F441_14639 [Phytophthora nicotianae CJ01A1]